MSGDISRDATCQSTNQSTQLSPNPSSIRSLSRYPLIHYRFFLVGRTASPLTRIGLNLSPGGVAVAL
jgi:hypothetical protein